jgi:hypothetical protein
MDNHDTPSKESSSSLSELSSQCREGMKKPPQAVPAGAMKVPIRG